MLRILLLSVTQVILTMAQSSPSVICAAGQCLMGNSNASIGAIVSASSTNVILLPGQYTYDSNPQYLHNVLTSSSISIHPSQDIFNVSSSVPISLPLSVNLNSGIATFASSLYSGQATFASLSSAQSNTNITLSSPSLLISPNTYASFTSPSSNTSIIIRDSIPDTAQLPSTLNANTLALTSLQSTLCSTPCSSAGVCTANGTCTCLPGFSGTSCESCASGFFGPSCQACPSGCTKCDDGISGSGVCSAFNSTSAPSSCNCVNGECGSGGKCQCNPGWTNAGNGTQCSACEEGFYSTPDGNCQICQLGCTSCAPLTGACLSCANGFTQNANDNTSCLALPSTTSSGTTCPDGSFSNGSSCEACSPECKTCTGPSSGECVLCAEGTYILGAVAGIQVGGNGSCVAVDSSGVCEGTSGAMVGNNDNHECDACPAKCSSCGIPNFNSASTINQAQCTGCLPGYVLSNGQCVESCPSGSSLSSNNTCIACPNNQLSSNGSCVSTCPSNTIKSPSSQSCTPCHPDCTTCSGTSFNQCSSCPPERPVLSNGRCLASCSGGEYFDSGSSKCQKCDGSCANCFASGAGSCLSCASSTQVLKSGQCVEASCTNSTSVISGLGVCLSDLVTLPSNLSNVATVQGLDSPTILNSSSGTPWWEPFLIVLFILLFILLIYLWWRKKTRLSRNHPNTQSTHLRGGARGNSRLARIFFHVKDTISNSIARAKAEREAKRERDRFNGMSFVEEARMYNAKREYQPQFTDIGERRPRSHRSRSRREREDFHDDGYTSRGRSDRSAGGSRKLNKDLPPAPSLPQYIPYQNETKETFYDVDLKTSPSAQSLRTGHQQNNGSHTHGRSQIPLKSKPSEISVTGSLARGPSRSRSVRPEQSKATMKSNKSNLHIRVPVRVPVPVPAHKTSKSHLQVPLRNAPSKASFSTYMTTASSYSQSENRSLYGGPPRNLLGFRKGTEVPPTPAQEYVMSVRSPKTFGNAKGKDVDYGNSAYDDESLWISRHQGQ